MLLLFLDCWRS